MMKKALAGILSAALLTGALFQVAFAEEVQQAPADDGSLNEVHALISPAPQAEDHVTRGAVVTRLWEMSGKPVVNYLLPFADVEQGSDSCEAIRWAASEGIVNGYGDASFGPESDVTREQLATMVYHYVQKFGMGFQGQWMFLMPYEDREAVSEWAFEPVMWMVSSRLFDTEQKELHPQQSVEPVEADAFFDGLVKLGEEKEVDFSRYGVKAE